MLGEAHTSLSRNARKFGSASEFTHEDVDGLKKKHMHVGIGWKRDKLPRCVALPLPWLPVSRVLSTFGEANESQQWSRWNAISLGLLLSRSLLAPGVRARADIGPSPQICTSQMLVVAKGRQGTPRQQYAYKSRRRSQSLTYFTTRQCYRAFISHEQFSQEYGARSEHRFNPPLSLPRGIGRSTHWQNAVSAHVPFLRGPMLEVSAGEARRLPSIVTPEVWPGVTFLGFRAPRHDKVGRRRQRQHGSGMG